MGTFTTAAWDWKIGDEVITGDRSRFKILSIVDADDLGSEEFSGAFVVTPLELAEP